MNNRADLGERFKAGALIENAFVDKTQVEDGWAVASSLADEAHEIEQNAADPGTALRALVGLYGRKGLLDLITSSAYGGRYETLSVRAICLVRERLGYLSPLADLAFAMQGLGTYPLTHAGGPAAEEWLPRARRGETVAAFALTEKNAGSDLAGIETTAEPLAAGGAHNGDNGYVLNGHKIFISNAGVADHYVVFARTAGDEAPASRRLTAFLVPADSPGVSTQPTQVLGGHPIGEVLFENVQLTVAQRVGEEGRGLGIALATLSRFRPTVGAAALGFAQRAMVEAIAHTQRRHQFGAPLAQLPQVQTRIGEMACLTEASRLLVYRCASRIDAGADRSEMTRTGSIAKLVATEHAQRVVDSAVQLHGGLGVVSSSVVAQLYQEVRALRIYEGASDIQRILIAREVMR